MNQTLNFFLRIHFWNIKFKLSFKYSKAKSNTKLKKLVAKYKNKKWKSDKIFDIYSLKYDTDHNKSELQVIYVLNGVHIIILKQYQSDIRITDTFDFKDNFEQTYITQESGFYNIFFTVDNLQEPECVDIKIDNKYFSATNGNYNVSWSAFINKNSVIKYSTKKGSVCYKNNGILTYHLLIKKL